MNGKISWLTLIGATLLSSILSAQDAATGAIAGTVTDRMGARIPQATLTVTSSQTHISRSASTDNQGAFRVSLLTTGPYFVTVEAPGFVESRTQDVDVVVSETTPLPLSLAVQGSGNTVEVHADAKMAQLESSSLGRVVDEEAINS